jgi:hypothetical protein
MRDRLLLITAIACVTGGALAFRPAADAQTRARGGGRGAAAAAGPQVWGTWNPMGRCFPNGVDCPWKLEEIPLNDRAVAHRDTFDETMAPKYDCVEATTPGIVADPYMMSIERRADRILIHYEKDDVTRTAWLDGRKPRPNEYTLHGFTTARVDGDALLLETTNFLYDPTGLDDMAGLPSSTRKKVLERYTRDGDLLRGTVTTEDPLFLVAPAVFSTQWRRAAAGAVMEKFECDAAEARQPLQFLPPKYKNTRAVPRRWQ